MIAIHKNCAIGVIFTLVCLVLPFLLLPCPVYAESVNGGYSNVLDDLKSDPNFDENLYPVNETDYSLQVVQIAESTDGELLVYVYQPSNGIKDYTATSINISTAINDSLCWNCSVKTEYSASTKSATLQSKKKFCDITIYRLSSVSTTKT